VSRRSAGDAVQLRVRGDRRPSPEAACLSSGSGWPRRSRISDRARRALGQGLGSVGEQHYWWLIPSPAGARSRQSPSGAGDGSRSSTPRRDRPMCRRSRRCSSGSSSTSCYPARADEVARVVFLHRRAAGSRAEVTGTGPVERAFDVLALLGLLFVALPWFPSLNWIRAAA
jgi:hypothetical protein